MRGWPSVCTERDIKELFSINCDNSPFQRPELQFNGLNFYYSDISEDQTLEIMGELQNKVSINDSTDIYTNQAGDKIIRIYVAVPTFDFGDRQWDSYRKLFIFPHENQIWGLLVAGGYEIARITCYQDLRAASDRTEKLMSMFAQIG